MRIIPAALRPSSSRAIGALQIRLCPFDGPAELVAGGGILGPAGERQERFPHAQAATKSAGQRRPTIARNAHVSHTRRSPSKEAVSVRQQRHLFGVSKQGQLSVAEGVERLLTFLPEVVVEEGHEGGSRLVVHLPETGHHITATAQVERPLQTEHPLAALV